MPDVLSAPVRSDDARLPLSMSVFVPTKDGGVQFSQLASHLAQQRDRWGLDVIIVDSGSQDDTVAIAQRLGFRVVEIPPSEFGHGRTRNLAMRLAIGDVVAFLSQDVLPCAPNWPALFAAHFAADPHVAGVFGRQIPRSADTAEMHFVSANYPPTPHRYEPIEGGQNPTLGRVLFSNAFSAVRRSLALAVPFENDIPVSEDQVWGKAVTARGWAIVYEPRAEALHGHRYTLRGLFRRTYLIAQAGEPFGLWGRRTIAQAIRLLGRELSYFVRNGHSHWVPWLLAYEFVRWLGFQHGRHSGWRPEGGSSPTHTVMTP